MSETVPSPRRAVIIAVGSELLTPFKTDTNSLFITAALNEAGIEVVAKAIVGDRRQELAAAIGDCLRRADLVVLTGGLGPTDDDVTRQAVSDALGLPLEEQADIVERIRQRFERRGMEMPPVNRVQALVLRGAVVLPNANGTAPGQWIEHGSQALLLLPGPPREMRPMFEAVMAERIGPRARGARIYRRTIKIAGRTESDVEQVTQRVYSGFAAWDPPVATSILAAPGQIELHFSVRSESVDRAGATLERAVAEILAVLGADVFSTDGRSLEHVVGDLLRARGWRIATAESCTGGLVASRLTDVAGSSDYMQVGVVCYSNAVKTILLGVPPEMIAEHGAVSEPVGQAMAEGLRERAAHHGVPVEVAIGITGIAGPGGGTDQKPVGTVVVAVASPAGTIVRRHRFPGGREQVKWFASQTALNMVRQALLAGGPERVEGPKPLRLKGEGEGGPVAPKPLRLKGEGEGG